MERFRQGMQRLASGVTVVTTSDLDGTRYGITATAVCSLTADPPTLVACVNRGTRVGLALPDTGYFCVNVLAHDQRDVAEVFAGAPGERFGTGSWTRLTTGAPVLEGALASFDCRTDVIVERSTHYLVIGAVVDAAVGADGSPLLYHSRRFAHLERLA
ncbi:flavin reductase family protein [Streptosporangium sp. NPDC051022]|uniref:flavin reductase family protein n=1 Tax=Streptosporangium sp. NPDC051022 TaxID=3155752 RepID=UPI00343F2B7A